MFSTTDREAIREELLEFARQNASVAGAALVGSAAHGREDAWSDIDLVLQLAPDADEPSLVAQWTQLIAERFGLADSFDVFAAGNIRYRVFLLTSSLQIDVSFWPHDEFRATEDGFRLVFGVAATATSPPSLNLSSLIGYGWLYALHARSAIARGRVWQATMMLDDLRNQVIALKCLRANLNPWHGREADRLPPAELSALAQSRAGTLTPESLALSQRRLITLFLDEIELHNHDHAATLRSALETIARTSEPTDS